MEFFKRNMGFQGGFRSSGRPFAPGPSLRAYYTSVFCSKYVPEFGFNPQDDFANQPKSRGLLDQQFST